MALNMDAIGKKIGPLTKNYDWKDVILYALGVGAGVDELDYTYEKNLKVIPSFSIAAIFDFLGQVGVASNVNLAGILHGEQELIFHNPIPTSGTLTTEGTVAHYYDKGPKGALVVGESETYHSNGKRLFTNISTVFARLDGGFGGPTPPRGSSSSPTGTPISPWTPPPRSTSRSSTGSRATSSSSTSIPNSRRWSGSKSRSCTACAPTASPAAR